MARKVFFSFYYDRDVRRVVQVRNSWLFRALGEAQPFFDAAAFEEAKRKSGGIEKWIENQLLGTSVTVVLYGAETSTRKWVNYEIERSLELNKGLLAIDIHNIKDPQLGTDVQGYNPFDLLHVNINGQKRLLSSLYKSYNWISNNGYTNIATWVEAAAKAVGR